MSFDNVKSYAANTVDAKKTDWQVFLSQWVGMLAVVAFQMKDVSTAIREHDKHSEMMMRISDTSNKVAEKTISLIQELQEECQRPAQSETADSTRPAGESSHNPPQSPTQQPPIFQWPE